MDDGKTSKMRDEKHIIVEALTKQKAHIESLLEGARSVLRNADFTETARSIFDSCKKFTGATAGYVALLSANGEENEVLFLDAGGMPCSVDPSLPMPIRGLRSEVYKYKKVMYNNDFADSNWMKFMPGGHVHLKNVMFAPLVIEDTVVGLMGLANKPGDFTDDDARMAASFGEIAAVALQNSRAKETITLALKHWQETFNAVTDMVVIIAPDHTIIDMNRAGCQSLNKSIEEIRGKKCFEIVHKRNHPIKNCPCITAMECHKPSSVIYEENKKIFTLNAWPVFDNNGKYSTSTHIVQDITEKKRVEEDKAKLEDRLRQTEKLEVIGQLAGGVAHDFNNILATIVGMADLTIEQLPADHPTQKYLSGILKSGERGAGLVNQLLSFARWEKIVAIPVNIHDLIERVITLLEHTIDPRIQIESNPCAQASTISGDVNMLESALLNLGINARDAMPDGGKLIFKTENLTIDNLSKLLNTHTYTPGPYIRLSIIDTGTGMDKKTQQHIFEPFYTTKVQGKGTGLGLASVFGCIKQHDGFIQLESDRGKGTRFDLYLPLIDKNIDVHVEDQAALQRPGGGHILVIDDDELMATLIPDMLSREGYVTTIAHNGLEAIETFQKQHENFDMVLLDIIMPEIDGYDCFFRLRDIDDSVPIIIASGFSFEGKAKKLMENGAHAFIYKPFRKKELLKVLAKVPIKQIAE